MVRSTSKNKILVALILTLTILSTLFVSNIFATDTGKVTPENTNTITVESAEHDESHEINGTRYISGADLANFYDYFCCYHGGVDSKLPGADDIILTTEQGSVEEPYLTYNDIGKKNFEITIDGEDTETPFKEGEYQHFTYGLFKVASSEICGPKEAYILSEMMYNMPYPSYVQNAWWTTEAGSKGAIAVPPNDLTIEAEAFEAYILEAAGVSTVDELGKNTLINYTFNDQEKTLDCGFDIKYEPKYNDDSNQDGIVEREEDGADRPTVSWDEDEQVYKIGPFSIDYIESKVQVGERAEVMFAGITNAELYTDASEEPLVRGEDWEFLWLHGERDEEDKAEYPHKNEVFYIKLNYIEGATKVTDLAFYFEYMNAAGKYEYLEGTYFTATWEADSKDNWCRVPGVHGPHGSDEDACDGKSCSHGEYRYHVESTTYWVELTSLEENKAQLLALGLSAAKVKFTAELHWEGDLPDNTGKLRIQKVLVDENGQTVSSNKRFKFNIYINGEFEEKVTVKANSSVTRTYQWGADEEAPTYRVEEIEEEGTNIIEIENAEGTLKNGRTVRVKAINQEDDNHTGTLRIDKIVQGNVKDKEYEFKVIIGNDVHNIKISEATGWTWVSPEYTWTGDNAPRYSVQEVNLPEGAKLISITPDTGYLQDNDSTSQVTVTAINEQEDTHKGTLKLDKIVQGNIKDKEYEFRVTIGTDVYNIMLSEKAGWSWTSPEYTWTGDNAPAYKVEEINIPEGVELISLTPNSGKLVDSDTSSQVTVTAVNGEQTNEYEYGHIKLTKRVTGDTTTTDTFNFKVTVSGGLAGNQEINVSLKAGETKDLGEFSWEKGKEAPVYKVEEVDIPEGSKLVSIENSSGSLSADSTVEVIATNEVTPKYEYGKLRITKKLDGNAISSDTFKFKVTINGGIVGHQELYVSLKADQTYESDEFAWVAGEAAPTYTVEEIEIPEGSKLVRIDNKSGSLASGGIAEVIAINELEEKTGKIRVKKEAITDDKQANETIEGTFTISVKISGTFEMNGESIVNGSRTITNAIGAGESFETPEIKWYGDEAPTYYVTETEMPQGWKLDSISSSNGSLEEGETIDITVTNIFTTRVIIDLTMEMAGDVWEDVPLNEDDKNTEDSVENGIYDRGQENPIDGVLVNIYRVVYKGNEELYRELATGYYDEEKTPIEFPLVTGEDTDSGHWYAPRMSVPALKPNEQGQGLKAKYDIEFIYDGQTYEPTKFLATSNGDASAYINATTSERDNWQNNSMALDINREEVNNRIQEVKGDTPIDGTTGMTDGIVVGQNGEQGIDYTSREQTVSDTTTRVSEVITTDSEGIALDVFKATARTGQGGLYYPFDNKIHLEDIDKGIDELGAYQKYIYSATYGYTQHINLGLRIREEADLFAIKDLVSAKVAVNGKVIEYKYNKLLDKLYGGNAENGEVVTVDDTMYIQAKEAIPGYDLKLYETDYYYRTEIYKDNQELYDDLNKYYQSLGLENVEDRELDVFLKYRIDLYNSSEIYDAEINEVLDYYDDSFELVEAEVKKLVQTQTENGLQEETVVVAEPSTDGNGNTINWTQTGEKVTDANGKSYKVMSTNALDGVRIKPGEKVTLNVTFKLAKATDSQGVQNAIRMEGVDAQKSNIVEIANYSTYYQGTDSVAGKIDRDSAPDNVNLNLQKDGNIESWFEDDTAAAPTLNMGYYDRTRNIDGLAWEDKEEEQVKDSSGNETNEYVGNGIYDEGDEQTLGGVTTELVEKITVLNDETGKYKEYDFIWPTDKSLSSLGGKTIEEITKKGDTPGFDSTTETGRATNVGYYNFYSVPAGNFVVRFTYGNQDLATNPSNDKIAVFNGHDYKTTAYQVTVNNKDAEGIINNEWHDLSNEDLANERVSDARDSETRRLEVIEKSKVITNVNGEVLSSASVQDADHTELYNEYYMYADTAKLNLDIEDLNNETLKNAIKNNETSGANGGIKITVLDSDTAMNLADIKYDIKQIDVGLEERSENRIVLDKQISEMTLTTSDKTVLLDAKYDINYTFNEENNRTTYNAEVKLNEASVGTDQLQALNKEEDKDSNPHSGQQNFRYINIEEKLLQGTTLTMKYTLTALNIGEVDLVGEALKNLKTSEEIKIEREKLQEATTLYTKNSDGTFTRENAIGKYLGSTYYNGKNNEGNKDVVAEVKVRQLIDYVDNDATFAAVNNMDIDSSWKAVTEPELLGVKEDGTYDYNNRLISMNTEENKTIFTLNEDGTINSSLGSIVDDKNVSYNTENKTNIILSVDDESDVDKLTNKGFMKALVPAAVSDENNAWNSQITLTTTKYFGTEADSEDMAFDNVAEVVKFEGTVGKRDIETTPGNTVPANGEFVASLEERDTSATELITLTPPTGANLANVIGIQLIVVILIGLLIVAVGIVVIKKKVLTK